MAIPNADVITFDPRPYRVRVDANDETYAVSRKFGTLHRFRLSRWCKIS